MTVQWILSCENHGDSLELTLSGNFSCYVKNFSLSSFFLFFSLKIAYFLFYAMSVFAYMCICALYMPDVLEGQKRAPNTSESELQMLMRCHVGAGN